MFQSLFTRKIDPYIRSKKVHSLEQVEEQAELVRLAARRIVQRLIESEDKREKSGQRPKPGNLGIEKDDDGTGGA